MKIPTAKENQTWSEEKEGLHFFFKIILPSCMHDGRLGIPVKFTREFGKELSSVAVLKVPSGKEWHVQVKEDEGRVWFEKGLHEFLEYHGISAWYFLVFRYDGNSEFHVVIFDMSASEIDYPCDAQDEAEGSNPEEKSQNHSSEEILPALQSGADHSEEVVDENKDLKMSQMCTTSFGNASPGFDLTENTDMSGAEFQFADFVPPI